MATHESLTIQFGEESECDYGYMVEIISTPCKTKDLVYIRLYAKSFEELENVYIYQEDESLGTGILKSKTESKTENITFEESAYAKTVYPIQTFSQATASTKIIYIKNNKLKLLYNKGTIVNLEKINDVCLKIKNNSKLLYGSVEIDYVANKKYREYKWYAPNVELTTTYPFFVVDENEEKILEKFNIEVQNKENIDVKLIIKDIANDVLLPDANIEIWIEDNPNFERLTGISDENGEAIFNLTTETTYNLKVTKEGYLSTNEDYISNDKFTVPALVRDDT